VILLDPHARPIIAHRGASGEYPENTLLAFDEALKQGADALEFDVRLTNDGAVVVFHDATVDRTTDGAGPIGLMTTDAIRDLDAGRGERVPYLREVLERYPETPIVLEIKEARAAAAAAQTILDLGAVARVLVGSFDGAALVPFRRPPFHVAASRAETASWWAASRVGLARWRPGYGGFTVPERNGPITVVDRRFLRAAHRAECPVHVWTVNGVTDARRLRALGVAGLITDYPARLRAAF
jgi:glycerophosphoryl diester phosphodiesterase